MALHAKKVALERDSFVDELYQSVPSAVALTTGTGGTRTRTLHRLFLGPYILKKFSKRTFTSPYADSVFSCLIEAESLFLLGFETAALSSIRGSLDGAFKFLYYEHHPIESYHHLGDKGHRLTNTNYRDFAYSFPGLCELELFSRDIVEQIWTELCGYTHADVNVIDTLTLVGDAKSVIEYAEGDFQSLLTLLKRAIRLILVLLLAAHSDWTAGIEKAYFDELWFVFTVEEKADIRTYLEVE